MDTAIPSLDHTGRREVSLMVSELCTNATLHSRGDFFIVDVEPGATSVVVRVTSAGNGAPLLRPLNPVPAHGRGLQVVEALADAWGSSSTDAGDTVVWFRRSLGAAGGS